MAHSPDPSRVRPHAGTRPLVGGNALCVGSMLTWAAGFPAAEILLQTWTPLALIAARFLLAVATLLSVWLLLEGPRRVFSAQWRRGAVIGGLAFGLGAYLLLVAQWMTDPVTVAIIASASPIAAAVVERVFDGRRLTRNFALGLGVSVLGGVIATGGGAVDIGLGAGLAVISAALFAWGSHLAVRDFPDVSGIGRSTLTLSGGLFFTGAACLVTSLMGVDLRPQVALDAEQLGYLAIYGLAGMALSQLLWMSSVARLGVSVAAIHVNIAPFYVMMIMWLLGDEWNWIRVLGATVVALGVLLAQRPDRLHA